MKIRAPQRDLPNIAWKAWTCCYYPFMFTLLSLAMNNEWDIQSDGNNDQISLLSSLNFFIYCFASKRFRASLRSLLAPLIPPKRSRDTSSTSNLPMSESSPLNQNEWYVRKISVNFFKVQSFLRVINLCQSTPVTGFEGWNFSTICC